jgi:hypothetical protein
LPTHGYGINGHRVFNGVVRQGHGLVHKMLGEVPGGLHDHTEQGRALNPPHLDCHWNNNSTWFPFGLRKDVRKVVTVRLPNNEMPKSIADV